MPPVSSMIFWLLFVSYSSLLFSSVSKVSSSSFCLQPDPCLYLGIYYLPFQLFPCKSHRPLILNTFSWTQQLQLLPCSSLQICISSHMQPLQLVINLPPSVVTEEILQNNPHIGVKVELKFQELCFEYLIYADCKGKNIS